MKKRFLVLCLLLTVLSSTSLVSVSYDGEDTSSRSNTGDIIDIQ